MTINYDRCNHCAARGNMKVCRATWCAEHETWYATELLREKQALEQTLRDIAEKSSGSISST